MPAEARLLPLGFLGPPALPSSAPFTVEDAEEARPSLPEKIGTLLFLWNIFLNANLSLCEAIFSSLSGIIGVC